jgi:glycosyltransferase involved in cell wall biosynthesis
VTPPPIIAALALGIWIYLLAFRGGFWLARDRENRDRRAIPTDGDWPSVVAIIPARNEALALPRTLSSLSAQNYPGRFSIVVVDDESTDGTGAIARQLAATLDREVTVLRGEPLPPDWTGKVWAMRQGIAHAETMADLPDYLLLTDADIEYPPDAVARLVAGAKASRTVLTSLMVKLNCESLAERALIPAFVYFFQMLYPFAWVNKANAKTAAAAGGCMLVDRGALARAGLARLERRCPELADLSPLCRHPPHGRALGLCRAQLFPCPTSRDRFGHGLDLSRGAVSRHFCAVSGQCCRSARLGLDDANLFADPAFLSRIGAVGRGLSLDRCGLFGVHAGFGIPALAGQGRHMEGTQSGACSEAMTIAPDLDASKTEHGENFPVASLLIAPRLRPHVLSFYRFARAADDIADHPTLSESSKFARLDALEATLPRCR